MRIAAWVPPVSVPTESLQAAHKAAQEQPRGLERKESTIGATRTRALVAASGEEVALASLDISKRKLLPPRERGVGRRSRGRPVRDNLPLGDVGVGGVGVGGLGDSGVHFGTPGEGIESATTGAFVGTDVGGDGSGNGLDDGEEYLDVGEVGEEEDGDGEESEVSGQPPPKRMRVEGTEGGGGSSAPEQVGDT